MDNKVTKKRLNDHLSYDWWKYLAIIIAAVFFWSLLFTMSSPRLAMSKKFELYVITSGTNTEGFGNFQLKLQASKAMSPEFVEMSMYGYAPGDSSTAQVLSTRIAVQEGDLYAFEYSDTPEEDGFGAYVDNGLFADFETLIAEARAFAAEVVTYDQYKAEHSGERALRKESAMQEAYESFLDVKARAKAAADELEGYIDDYADAGLFRIYAQYTVSEKYTQQTPSGGCGADSGEAPINEPGSTVEPAKIWGLDFEAMRGRIDDTNNSFLYARSSTVTVDPETGAENVTTYALNIALGITVFKNGNMPLYYENLAFVNYLIRTFYL